MRADVRRLLDASALRTITVPLLRPGLFAAWLLLFIASVRELGASILLHGPALQGDHAGDRRILVRAPSRELTATMALIQTLVVGGRDDRLAACADAARRTARSRWTTMPTPPAYRGRRPRDSLRRGRRPCAAVSFNVHAGRTVDAARTVRLRQDHDAARRRRAGAAERGRDPDRRRTVYSLRRAASTSRPKSAACRWCSSPTPSGRT